MIAPPGSRPRATARASVNTSQRIFSPRLLVWLAHIIAVRGQPWQPLDKVLEQWAPLAGVPVKANTHERAYEHMLHLRKLQKPGSRFGHIGWHPIQSFKYYWFARQRAVAAAVQGQTPPTTCEIGFGDAGMSAAIFLTATSSPASAELGGDHHVFDCPACGTESGDDGAWLVASKRRASSYLLSVFGSSRLHQYNGLSHQLIPQVAREQPGLSCDVISIDGDHSYEGVAKDIAAVANSTLWNQDSIVLFDDVLWGVAKAINNSIARKVLTIKERFEGDYQLDETFTSAARRRRPTMECLPNTHARGTSSGYAEIASACSLAAAKRQSFRPRELCGSGHGCYHHISWTACMCNFRGWAHQNAPWPTFKIELGADLKGPVT